jgi:hypothetical protein
MKSHNDNQLKNIFDEREISPSKKSWETLSSLLDEHLPERVEVKVSKKSSTKAFNLKYTLPIAAVITLFFALGYNYITDDFKPVIKEKVNKEVTHVSDTPVTINEIDEAGTESENIKVRNNAPSVKQQIFAETESVKVNTIQNHDSIKPETVNYVNNSIQINWDNSKIKKATIQPNDLLRSVERELLQDRAEKELEKSQNKFEQIRMAILNRNIQE